MLNIYKKSLLTTLRVSMGFIFFWAFLDKTFGFGFATLPAKAWISGVSPTLGYLSHTSGALAPVFQGLSGSVFVEWLFMLGLLGLGLALILGIGLKIASVTGSLLLVLMWLSQLPLANNPFLSEHLIYAMVIMFLATVNADQWFGFGRWWRDLSFVKNNNWLQ